MVYIESATKYMRRGINAEWNVVVDNGHDYSKNIQLQQTASSHRSTYNDLSGKYVGKLVVADVSYIHLYKDI